MEKDRNDNRQAAVRIPDFGIAMDKTGILELEGMEFHAYHGCLDNEKKEGNLFTVDFRGSFDMSGAAATDRLDETLDYGIIYGIVSREMEIPSDLLEHVAGRIVRAIEDSYPSLRFSIRVSKKNPPVGGMAAWSRVTLKSTPDCNEKQSKQILK